ncbi:MAG: helicase domain-containing protein [Rhodospirillaceae bacterium]|nr:MAG: helicase domain-containing protein [Rhodospirillaceae bacterium]
MKAQNPSHASMEWMAGLFRSCESAWGPLTPEDLKRSMGGEWSKLRAKNVLAALRDPSSIPRHQLETKERLLAVRVMRANTPVARLISRHTRALLRAYFKAGKISTRIADRDVVDRFVEMTQPERILYDEVERYISETYNQASDKEKSAVGFVLTIYRKRLASSFHALRKTLENHLEAIDAMGRANGQPRRVDEDDIPDDDETLDDAPDIDEALDLERQALTLEEKGDIERLLGAIRALPPDTKLRHLLEELATLRADGYRQAMVFTGYTDTMDFLRDHVAADPAVTVMCFSGRGGEVRDQDGTWRRVSRDEVKRRFREGMADILLCTDAAAEGLNFQFCGALLNYDMPWNPMRVEQRIGRIDRLGQRFERVRIVNLHYADTVEADVYCSLRDRIGLFQSVVGTLQPILAKLPSLIADRILRRRCDSKSDLETVHDDVVSAVNSARDGGFDLDAVTDADLEEPPRPSPPLDMNGLELLLRYPEALPPGLAVRQMGDRQWAFGAPGMAEEVRISTDPTFVEEHPDTVELWSPGNPLFPTPDVYAGPSELPPEARLDTILQVLATLMQ